MAEELQHLLERIRREGVEKAEAEAAAIIAKAREQAAVLVREADEKALAAGRRAAAEAETLRERSLAAIRQAGRDLVLAVGEALQTQVLRLLTRQVGDALAGDLLPRLVEQAVTAYLREGQGVSVSIAPADRERLLGALRTRLAEAAQSGLEIRPEAGITAGFRVSLAGGGVEHDFTAEAVADALGQLLRPQLAAILRGAARG